MKIKLARNIRWMNIKYIKIFLGREGPKNEGGNAKNALYTREIEFLVKNVC